jgi:four helix bundle protein
MHDFRRLHVWQFAREFAIELDTVVRTFPRRDRGAIASQLRRSALSISANIAEGCGKSSRKETIRFLDIASGSAMESEHHIQIAGDLGYLRPELSERLMQRAVSIQRMLRGLSKNLPA